MKKYLFILFISSLVHAETIDCQITQVISGDSFICTLPTQEQMTIKLYQIAAPKQGRYAEEAKNYLPVDVRLKIHGKDKQHRTLATAYKLRGVIGNGDDNCVHYFFCTVATDLNQLLIQNGLARYQADDPNDISYQAEYLKTEQFAKKYKSGLWSDNK